MRDSPAATTAPWSPQARDHDHAPPHNPPPWSLHGVLHKPETPPRPTPRPTPPPRGATPVVTLVVTLIVTSGVASGVKIDPEQTTGSCPPPRTIGRFYPCPRRDQDPSSVLGRRTSRGEHLRKWPFLPRKPPLDRKPRPNRVAGRCKVGGLGGLCGGVWCDPTALVLVENHVSRAVDRGLWIGRQKP